LTTTLLIEVPPENQLEMNCEPVSNTAWFGFSSEQILQHNRGIATGLSRDGSENACATAP
jgi:hypothetical protein